MSEDIKAATRRKIMGDQLLTAICEACGMEVNNVRRVILDCTSGMPVKVYFETFGDTRLLDIQFGDNLAPDIIETKDGE